MNALQLLHSVEGDFCSKDKCFSVLLDEVYLSYVHLTPEKLAEEGKARRKQCASGEDSSFFDARPLMVESSVSSICTIS